MTVVGVIAEYNPFHNGHRHQIAQIHAHFPDDACVAVMSGSFTQRGQAAILDKWLRAQSAVENGLDLVLEIPVVFAVRSAQHFADGGVRLLSRLGVVDVLAFGAELSDGAALLQLAEQSLRPDFAGRFRQGMRQGLSYAAALEGALDVPPELPAACLREPNTILALEYLKALRRFSSPLRPLPLPREGAGYHDLALAAEYPSASAIRLNLRQGGADWARAVPPAVAIRLKEQQARGLPDIEQLFRPVLARLLSTRAKDLRRLYGMNEGLEHRFMQAARSALSLADLRQAVSSKRYPAARIQRTVLSLLLSLSAADAARFDETGPLYARVLAFNDRGRKLLRTMRKVATIPLVTKVTDLLSSPDGQLSTAAKMLTFDTLATDLWGLSLSPRQAAALDFTISPVYLPEGSSQR